MDELSLMIIVPLLLSISYVLVDGDKIKIINFMSCFFVTMFFWWVKS